MRVTSFSMPLTTAFSKLLLLFISTLLLSACQNTYYSALEQVGIHKRDIMVSRLENSQQAQEEAQQQFTSAMEQFKSVINFNGGELEAVYNKLNNEYKESLDAVTEVQEKITDVESVSTALFKEWLQELALYSNPKLRQSSEKKLSTTKQKYNIMLSALKQSEQKMQPILRAMNDQVLYLKHNLNAQAINALKPEFNMITADIKSLIKHMEYAIEQNKQFIKTLSNT